MKPNSLLFRQVNPSWIRNERITSQAFTPTKKDQNLLSVYDGEIINARNSYQHYTQQLGHISAGVVAVTPEEGGQHDLSVRSDPQPFREHAVIDFGLKSGTAARKAARHLTEKARQRGWRYKVQFDGFDG